MSSFFRTTKGLAVDFAGTFVLLALGLIIIPAYISFFGEEGYGLWVTASGIVGMSLLVDSGVTLFLLRNLGSDSRDTSEDSSILSNSIAAQAVVCLIAVLLAVCLVVGLALWGDKSNFMESRDFKLIFAAFFLVQLITLLLSPYRISIYARQQLFRYNSVNTANSILTMLAPLLFYQLGFGLAAFPIASLFCNMTFDLYCIHIVRRDFPGLSFSPAKIRLKTVKTILFSGGVFTAIKAAEIIRLNMARVIVGTVLGPHAATAYTVTSRTTDLAVSNASKIGNAIFPLASTDANRNDEKQREQLCLVVSKVAFRIAMLFSIGIFLLNEFFVDLWVGSDQGAGPKVTMILSGLLFLRCIQACVGALVYAANKYGMLPWIAFGETGLGIVFAIFGSRVFGVEAVAVGLTMAYSLSTLYFINFTRLEVGYSWARYAKVLLGYSFPSALGSLVFYAVFRQIFPTMNYLTFVVVGAALVTGNLVPEFYKLVRNMGLKNMIRPKSVLLTFRARLLDA